MIFLPENPCCNPVPVTNTIPCPGSNPCASNIVSSDYVGYSGPNLPCTTIQTCNTLTVSLQKLDEQICILKSTVYSLQQQINAINATTTTTTTLI
jgi:hypothetical protein